MHETDSPGIESKDNMPNGVIVSPKVVEINESNLVDNGKAVRICTKRGTWKMCQQQYMAMLPNNALIP
uniref:Uncharacterized protein n=1 Tax=Romanomermis culicivorax TaxID=13658 RepID=A0A915IPV5_ROMCU